MTEEAALRHAIVTEARRMNQIGLNQGTSGNISARLGDTMLITPSATPYETMQPGDLAAVPLHDDPTHWQGPLQPSTEWRFHRDILRARPGDSAVVHTHATYCTVLAIQRRPIPACHYMIAAFGGDDVRCAPYATYGTEALAAHALAALEGRNACLLANHGMIVAAPTLAKAMWLAVELETIARQYYLCAPAAPPVLLTPADIADTRNSFASYGLNANPAPKAPTFTDY